jgi:hypothetical protein
LQPPTRKNFATRFPTNAGSDDGGVVDDGDVGGSDDGGSDGGGDNDGGGGGPMTGATIGKALVVLLFSNDIAK